jgi:hypothetical protein
MPVRRTRAAAAFLLGAVLCAAAPGCVSNEGRSVGVSAGPGCIERSGEWDPCRREYRDCMKRGGGDDACHAAFQGCVERACASAAGDAGR